jgi:hypothetical protein
MFALVAAIMIEALNLKFVVVPIDVGLPDDAPLYAKLLAAQWVYLHYLGLLLTSPFSSSAIFKRLFYPVLFVSGYLETALLLIAGVLIFRWIRGSSGALMTSH